MGSHCTPPTYPQGTYSVPPRLKRTLQTPGCPSGMGQQCPQAKQRTRSRSSFSYSSPSRVCWSTISRSVGMMYYLHFTPHFEVGESSAGLLPAVPSASRPRCDGRGVRPTTAGTAAPHQGNEKLIRGVASRKWRVLSQEAV